MAYKLKSNTNKIRFVKATTNPSYDGSHYEKLISKEFGNDNGTAQNNSFMLLPDSMDSIDNDDYRYFCFYKNSVYARVIRVKNSIYFSFKISKEMMDRLLTEEEKSHTKTN